jgi:hypothetical protein
MEREVVDSDFVHSKSSPTQSPIIQPVGKKSSKLWIWIVVVVVVILIIGSFFVFSNGTSMDFGEIIAKNDEVTNKRTLALVAASDDEGLKRAGVSDEELIEITKLINKGDLESFKKLGEFGATAEEMQLILEFLISSGRINEEEIGQMTDNVHAEVLESVKNAVDEGAAAWDAELAAQNAAANEANN